MKCLQGSIPNPFAPRFLLSGSSPDQLTPRPYPPPRNFFVPMHLETKLPSRKNPPLSKPFRISILRDLERLRPYPPLSKSFRINNVTNLPQKAPLSKSFGLNRLQTTKKAPLSKSFRIISFQKQGVFFRNGLNPGTASATECECHAERVYARPPQAGYTTARTYGRGGAF